MPALHSDSPIQYVKGVGPVRAQAFASLGVKTVADLLEYLPFRYEHESGEVEIADLQPGISATIRGTITRVRGGGGRSDHLPRGAVRRDGPRHARGSCSAMILAASALVLGLTATS